MIRLSDTIEREEYDVTVIPLSATMTDKPYFFDANTVIIAQVPIGVTAKINDVANKELNLQIFRRFDMKIKVMYLTTTATSTTDLIIFASKTISVGTSGFGSHAILTDSLAAEYDARDIVSAAVLSNADNIDDAATEYTGEIVTEGYNKLTGWIFASHALTLTINVYLVTGGTRREIDTIAIAANTEVAFEIPVVAGIMEIGFNNASGNNTTTCEKAVNLSSGA